MLLTTHRELKQSSSDTTELDAHLEQCANCRQVLASSYFIGEQVRSLPSIEPSPTMYTQLMGRLAVEHAQHLQHSPANALPPPVFLKPYLQEHLASHQKTSPLAAFSTADTGPLPVLSPVRKKSRRSYSRQMAFVGLAAVFFVTLLMGGITSLLFMTNGRLGTTHVVTSIVPPTDVVGIPYKTTTTYQHVVSAVADSSAIYYTAYGDGLNNNWMLEKLDRNTKLSTPLLSNPSLSPLIVLGANDGWLVWLQYDTSKSSTSGTIHHPLHALLRSWNIHSMYVGPLSNTGNVVPEVPVELLTGTFDQDTAPDWIHSPVQGIWFVQDTLLVAMVDENGISHLLRYQLDAKNTIPPTELAKAIPGHILTSPTANSDGTQMFWSEEWRTDDGNLHSNIWTRQVVLGPIPIHGRLLENPAITRELFLSDGLSFRPLVVDNTLVFLSTAPNSNITPTATSASPTASPATTPSAVATTNTSNVPGISWADASVYTPSLDSTIHGNVLLLPLDGDPLAVPTQVNALGLASSLQAGADFVLWQSDDGSYGMYDILTKADINVGSVLDNAQFLAVNDSTAVWTIDTSTDPTNTITPSATLMAFNWPQK